MKKLTDKQKAILSAAVVVVAAGYVAYVSYTYRFIFDPETGKRAEEAKEALREIFKER